MNRNTHLHFIIQSYESVEPRTGNYINATTFDLICASIEEARARVRNMMPQNRIVVREVIEHFDDFPCSG